MTFKYHNPPSEAEPQPPFPLPSSFKLRTPPGTDVWRKPPSLDVFSAPICYRSLKLSSFRRARVSISADWKTLFDQGGLCLILPSSPASSPDEKPTRKWIKTGIEVYNRLPHVSTVACDRWADWSLWPLTGAAVTIEMERESVDGKLTSTLWVSVVEGETRRPIREVTWVFAPDNDDADCWVGLYTAKPTKDEDDETRHLEVEFRDFHIETA